MSKKSTKAKYLTKSSAQTKKLGSTFARKILNINSIKGAHILGLRGDLGGGKTTFLQGFASGLGIKQKILSPTFIIMRRYPIKVGGNFYHIDCYRIQKAKDLLELGLKKIISDPQNIIAIEWAERIKKALPQRVNWLDFEFKGKNKRQIIIKYHG